MMIIVSPWERSWICQMYYLTQYKMGPRRPKLLASLSSSGEWSNMAISVRLDDYDSLTDLVWLNS